MAKKDYFKLTQEEIAGLSPDEFVKFQAFFSDLKSEKEAADLLIVEQANQIQAAESGKPHVAELPAEVSEKYQMAEGLSATKIILPAPDRREIDFTKISLAKADEIAEKFKDRYLVLK